MGQEGGDQWAGTTELDRLAAGDVLVDDVLGSPGDVAEALRRLTDVLAGVP